MKKEKTSTNSAWNVHLLLAAYSGYKMIKSKSYLRPAFEFLVMEKKYLLRKKKKKRGAEKKHQDPGRVRTVPAARACLGIVILKALKAARVY